MGKRKKSSRGPTKKIKQTLATTFSCLFCNHDNSVVCTMDKKSGVGNLYCKICGQSFQAAINSPIDVYSEWVDACEAVAANEGKAINDSIDGTKSPVERAEELHDLSEDDEDF